MRKIPFIVTPPPAKSAFSLVELSIVLVILGLLVGGVLSGQSLIRAAELRSVSTEYSKYIAATQTFRDKYFALPGDMSNAQSYWGVAHATPATCVTTASTSALTCNGNGDGVIQPSTGSNESYRFWQHLANAGLLEGSYSGITDGSNTFSSTAANSPKGKLGNTLWFSWNYGTQTASTFLFNGSYNNVLGIGAPAANNLPATAVFKNEEMWNIDTKMDDGKPAIGSIVVGCGPLSNCTTTASNTALDASYLLTGTGITGTLIFRNVY